MKISAPFFFVSLFCFLAMGTTFARADTTVAIGSRLELFVDHTLIDTMDNTRLRFHHPVKAARPKSPLPVEHMVTVTRDGDIYRAWYRSYDPSYTGDRHSGNSGEMVKYAESTDGKEWTFPHLRLHKINGTLDNNVILANWPPYLTNFMPFLDSRPGVDPAERYKAIAGYPGPGNKTGTFAPNRGLFGFVSSDGIHWTKREEIIPYRSEWRHAFDSPNVAFWSEAEQRYVCYFRTWIENGRVRSISRSTSQDFVNWTDPVEMKPNLPGEHLYTNMTHPYVRAPHIYISMPTRFVPQGKDSADKVNSNITDVLFMTSRAGSEHYDRPFTEAFIRPGLDPKRWLNRANYVAQNVIQTGPAELSIYHRSGDRYTIRPDGFISVNADTVEGTVLTKPITFSGQTLVLNYSTSAAGSIRVEILDNTGNPIPGFGFEDCEIIYGDTITGTVRWKDDADLSALSGLPVKLRFYLQEADLFAFRFQ